MMTSSRSGAAWAAEWRMWPICSLMMRRRRCECLTKQLARDCGRAGRYPGPRPTQAEARMTRLALAGALFFVLCGAAALGSYVRAKLPEIHRSSETMTLVQVTISLLVTFTSIVLGLLTGAVTTQFQQASRNDGLFAGQLVQVDQCLRDYGPETAQMRQQFRGYVAAVLTSTWPDEPPPKDISHPDVSKDPVLGEGVSLTALLTSVRTEL